MHPTIKAAMDKARTDWDQEVRKEAGSGGIKTLVAEFPVILARAYLDGKRELKMDAQGLKHGEAIALAVREAYGMSPTSLDETYIRFQIPDPTAAVDPALAVVSFNTVNVSPAEQLVTVFVMSGTVDGFHSGWLGGSASLPLTVFPRGANGA